MGKATWHVGSAWSVEDDALYDIGDFATRDEAIAAGMRDTDPGGHFYIIEASLAEHEQDDFDPDMGIPFVEVLTGKQRIDVPKTLPTSGSGAGK